MMMLLNAYLHAMQAKHGMLAMIAVTKKGIQLGSNFGMKQTHTYSEDGARRVLMTIGSGELSLAHVNKKLKIGKANSKILQDLCSRHGLQERTKTRIYPRC